MRTCIFCAIAAGEAPARVVDADDDTLAFLDLNPATRGHTLVIPRAHHDDWWDTPEALVGPIMRTAHRVAQRLRDTLTPDGLNLFQSTRAAAFQSVFHVHVHVIPRYRDDGLRLPWRPSPAEPDELAATADRIGARPHG